MKAILAIDANTLGMGFHGEIPHTWDDPNDMKHFVNYTKNSKLFCGPVTFSELKKKMKKISGRELVEIHRGDDLTEGILVGGPTVFNDLLTKIVFDEISMTYFKISSQFYDCFLDLKVLSFIEYNYEEQNTVFENENIKIVLYSKFHENKEEQNYLDILNDLITNCPARSSRNHDVHSSFSRQLVFDTKKGSSFPILTSKRIFWKGVVEELLFFLSGSTDAKILSAKGVKIWDLNTKDTNGEMGPMYGHNFRNFGGGGKGVDQLEKVTTLLKTDPYSRRILMTSFDPSTVDQGVLYPCHGLVIQFYVEEGGLLSLKMYQRSADFFLGVPFNISSYALLLYIVASYVDMTPGRVILDFGDCHVYTNHIDEVKEQIKRKTSKFPSITFKKGKIESISTSYFKSLSVDDFILNKYLPQPAIKADMIP